MKTNLIQWHSNQNQMTLSGRLLRRSVPSPSIIQGHYSSAISTKMESQGKFWRTTLSTISEKGLLACFSQRRNPNSRKGAEERKTTQNWLQVGLWESNGTLGACNFFENGPSSINHLLFEQTLHLHEAPITILHVRSIFRWWRRSRRIHFSAVAFRLAKRGFRESRSKC